MALPDVTLSIRDNSLGILPPSSAKAHLKIGAAPLGLVNTVFSIGDLSTLTATFGKGGDLVEAIALALQQGGPVYAVNVNPSTYGTPGAVTKTAAGTGSTSSLTVLAKPFAQLIVKVSTGGTLGVAAVVTSVDNGLTFGAPQLTAATLMLNMAPFVTAAFSAGTYTIGDYWTVATDGTVTFTGSGVNGCTLSASSSVDGYSIIVLCTAGGALGAAQFTYSMDGGNTYSGALLVPASGKYVVPDTGILLTFTNALVLGDAWSCTVTPASYTTTDLTNAMNAALADSRTWGFVHVVGPASTVAGAATVATTLDGLLTTALASYRFARGIIEVPTDTDANILTAFASTTSLRVAAVPGFAYLTSPLSGRQFLNPAGFAVAARAGAGAAQISDDLGKVANGALPSTSLTATNTALAKQRDESATPGLDAGRFTTLRSIIGRIGTFITKGRTLATPGSDYSLWQNGRVIDTACSITRDALLAYLNASLRVNSDGTINEKDAQGIEASVTSKLNAGLVAAGDASAASVVVNRTANILSTQTLPVSVRVTPLGYASNISVDIGFQNPALTITK
jgi:hypothetical protein